MKKAKQARKILAWMLLLCLCAQSTTFVSAAEENEEGEADPRCGYIMPEKSIDFVPKDQRGTSEASNVRKAGSDSVTGYYSGITFQNATSPYCTDAYKTYNADHSLYITDVRNQGGLGTCWIFGTTGTLETAIWKQLGEKADISEAHTTYGISNSSFIASPYSSYEGKDTEFWASDGGYETIIMAYWVRGAANGLVPETAFAYNANWSDDQEYIWYGYQLPPTESLCDMQVMTENYGMDYYPAQIIKLGTNTQYTKSGGRFSSLTYSAMTAASYIRETKDMVAAFGAVAIGYYHDSRGMSTDAEERSVYCYNEEYYDSDVGETLFYCNHEVMIVGWDDTIDCGTTNKGAFLIKNSYGTDWGDDGYFWLSYDCYYADPMAVAKVVHTSDLYDTLYETDGTLLYGNYNSFGSNEYAMMKRSYTTASSEESLTGAMVYAEYPETEYKVYYTDNEDGESGWAELSVKTGGALASGSNGYVKAMDTGYLTLEFSAPPTVSGNFTIAVVARNSDGFDIYGTDLSDPLYGTEVASGLYESSSEITADTIKNAQRVDERAPVNFSLKAFTKQTKTAVSAVEEPNLYNAGAAFSGRTATFTVGDWTKAIPVYLSYTAGTPAQYITADVSGGKLTLTVSSSLRSNLSGYVQRLYLGFRDDDGSEIRVPVTVGENGEVQEPLVLRNGILYINSSLNEDSTYVAAVYDSTTGQMTGAAAAKSNMSLAFNLKKKLPDEYTVKIYQLGEQWLPQGILGTLSNAE